MSLLAGQVINPDRPLVFNVDRIDSYMEKYDVLPTFSTPLVSARFKNEFDDLGDDIQFLNAVIVDKKIIAMKTITLRLRPFRTIDAKTIITWTSEPSEFYMWSAGLLGVFPASEQKLLEAVSARENNPRYFPLVFFDEDGIVGFLTIRTPGEDDKKVALGYVIIDPSKRNKGYGRQMLKLTLKFAFGLYGANEVSLDVFDSNKQAYNCYKSIGFVETGKQEHIIIGEYSWNYIEMVIKSNK